MLERIVTVAIIAGLGYWYWTGPYRERTNPTYGETLQQNARAMEECMERKNYSAGRSVSAAGDVEKICARQLNLYFEDGHWYSYDDVRRD